MSTAPVTIDRIRCLWRVHGQVQGVGFRPFVYRVATELSMSGTVRNDPAGVTIEVWADAGSVEKFERRLRQEAPPLARLDAIECLASGPTNRPERPFRIVASDASPDRRGRITVDSAVCDDCRRELLDPTDRRHRHALINCTNCGPRYTIVRDLPYDRPRTTMASFAMCGPCESEYRNPADRRFHAQPTCCTDCGPRLELVAPDGRQLEPAMANAANLLRGGEVIAMKGVGGYHLVADAACEMAIMRLRHGKRRDQKPFAVMVPDLADAMRLVELSPEARLLLESPVCPIVLAPRHRDERRSLAGLPIAPAVAPGSHRLGVMLPYTPMQHLLFNEGVGALVMTSANLSDDPLISEDDDAQERLGGFCDAILRHDRPIERAVDDSVVIDGPNGILPLRRARGYVPAPIRLPVTATRPGLCTGGELKNVVAVVQDHDAVLSQHLGDLSYALAYERFERTIDDLLRLFDITPSWIACDAHPQYLSRQYARRRAGHGCDLLPVQHHHAHLAALLAEHGRDERIVGLVCDGVGYGDDGMAWGGEVLVGNLLRYRRAGRMRPLRLPGGDAAARQTGRCALSWLHDWIGAESAGHPLAQRALPDERVRRAVLAMLEQEVNCPPSSGMGRLFDAAASLLGLCDYNHHEAMSGMCLEAAASGTGAGRDGSGVVLIRAESAIPECAELDHRPLLARLWQGLESGESTAELAWLFHDALADGLARLAVRIARLEGLETVGLSGGVFCNTLLTRMVRDRLAAADLEVLVHRVVPPNDGGIALGQAAIAAAVTAASAN